MSRIVTVATGAILGAIFGVGSAILGLDFFKTYEAKAGFLAACVILGAVAGATLGGAAPSAKS